MPTYDFSCRNGHIFEEFYRTISEAPEYKKCPKCGKRAKRLIGAGGGVIFKGDFPGQTIKRKEEERKERGNVK